MTLEEQFDREEWIRDLVIHGCLTPKQAEALVRFKQDEGIAQIAGALRVNQVTAWMILENAFSKSNGDLLTYFLAIGPLEFHHNREDYPELEATLQEVYDPEKGIRPMRVSPVTGIA